MTKTPTKRFTVSDGTLMLYLEPAEEGGYVVSSPLDPELLTQAETVEETFAMAYDAAELLAKFRAKQMDRKRTTVNSKSIAKREKGVKVPKSP